MPISDTHDVSGISFTSVFGRSAVEMTDHYFHISDTNGMAVFGKGTDRLLGYFVNHLYLSVTERV
jgi:hypothetical protein